MYIIKYVFFYNTSLMIQFLFQTEFFQNDNNAAKCVVTCTIVLEP